LARSLSDVSRRKQAAPRKKLPVVRRLDKTLEALAVANASPSRLIFSLNQDWRFRRFERDAHSHDFAAVDSMESSAWEQVNLPHSARIEPLNASGGRNFQGICCYFRELSIPPEWKGRIIYLHFEGAMQVADVWLNGRKLATNHCGYLPFAIDLTRELDFGAPTNRLAVRLDNRDNPDVPPGKLQRELDFTYFGGLYRNVRLEVMDPLHISDAILDQRVGGGGVFVTFPRVSEDSAAVEIKTDVRNESPEPRHCLVVQELLDPSGRLVARAAVARVIEPDSNSTFVHSIEVTNPHLWHPNHPHLHTLKTRVFGNGAPVDELSTRIGIRRICFDPSQGLLINGQKFFSIGANRHQDHPYVGYAMPDSAQYRDVKKLREAGFTSYRSHYPQAVSFLDACDELGMLAIVSNPGWQFVGGEKFQDRAVANARLMVRRDRNHPSVILWEAALNESDNRPILPRLQKAIHEEYPGDQCFTAGDREKDGQAWDVDYLRGDGSKPTWIREWGDHVDNWSDQQSRSRVPRAWGETPLLIQATSHASRLDEIISGRCSHARGSDFNRLGGANLWAGIDCQRGYHRQPFFGGVLDLFRLPKFSYYFFQSQRPPEIHVPGLSDGPMVFIANYATFLSPTTVTVFSNCDEVRLSLDGREIARKRPDTGWSIPHPPFTFHVDCFAHEQSTMYMTGVARVEKPPLEVLAEGITGGIVVASHIVHPPGAPRALELRPDFCGRTLTADGSDWIRLHANILDARGTLCPLSDETIDFSVSGDAKLIGPNPAPTEAGIATILLQSGKRPGKITLQATAFALTPAHLEIPTTENPARVL
jgi:beta-galactosidase